MQFRPRLVPLALAVAFAGTAGAQEVVRIAHVGPISGALAHLGKDNENGARMAIDDLNARGFTIGGKPARFVLLAEDDAADPKQGTAVAQKLVDARVNGVIGHANSGTTVPASRIYMQAGIPQISPTATTPVYTNQHFKTTFRVVANDNKLGSTLGRHAVQSLKARRIAVIDDRSAYGQGVADEFRKAAQKAGAQIVDRQFTNPNANDFTAILTSIRGKKPDLVFFGGMDSVGGPMLRQMKALGIQAKFMGGDGICTTALARLAGDALADDMVTCAEAGGVSGAQEKGIADFRARYKAQFGTEQQLYAPYVYDAVMVMATAMKNSGSAAPAKYLPELKKIRYEGLTGTIAFDAKGDIKDGAMTLYTFRNGEKAKLDVIR